MDPCNSKPVKQDLPLDICIRAHIQECTEKKKKRTHRAALFILARSWKQSNVHHQENGWMVGYSYNGILYSNKNWWIMDVCNNLNKQGEQFWNKKKHGSMCTKISMWVIHNIVWGYKHTRWDWERKAKDVTYHSQRWWWPWSGAKRAADRKFQW